MKFQSLIILLILGQAFVGACASSSGSAGGTHTANSDAVTLSNTVDDPYGKDEPRPAKIEKVAEKSRAPANLSDLEILRQRTKEVMARDEVDVNQIQVHHILISKDQGEDEAAKAYKRVLAGEDFNAIAKEYDVTGRAGGPYRMWQKVNPTNSSVYPRSGMIPSFGDVGWRLKVGEVGIAPYDEAKSPYGWHIMKRLE